MTKKELCFYLHFKTLETRRAMLEFHFLFQSIWISREVFQPILAAMI